MGLNLSFLDLKNDFDTIEDIKKLLKEGLRHGITIGAYKLDSEGNIEDLIGSNFLLVVSDDYTEFVVTD